MWLKPDESSGFSSCDICPKGYSFLYRPRSSGSGDSLAILHRSKLNSLTMLLSSPSNIWNYSFPLPLLPPALLQFIVHRHTLKIDLLFLFSWTNLPPFWNVLSHRLLSYSYAVTLTYILMTLQTPLPSSLWTFLAASVST